MSAREEMKTVPFEVKAASGDGSTGSGLASVFHNCDSAGEIVDSAAFDGTLPDFLANGFLGMNHDWSEPVGKPTDAKATREGLLISWKISPTTRGKDLMVLLKDRVLKSMSIGYRVLEREMLESMEAVKEYWASKGYKPSAQDLERAQGGATLLKRLHLYEASVVSVPCNELAAVRSVKQASPEEVRRFEYWLHSECGLSRNDAKHFISRVKQTGQAAGGVTGSEDLWQRSERLNRETDRILEAAGVSGSGQSYQKLVADRLHETLRKADRAIADYEYRTAKERAELADYKFQSAETQKVLAMAEASRLSSMRYAAIHGRPLDAGDPCTCGKKDRLTTRRYRFGECCGKYRQYEPGKPWPVIFNDGRIVLPDGREVK